MKKIVKLSGGKDSLAVARMVALACAVQATEAEFEMVFCDTGWEHPDTYTYLDLLEQKFGQPIIRVKSTKYPEGFKQMVGGKKRFPSRHARFCTLDLKVFPGIDYVLTQTEDVIVYQGIRADESEARKATRREEEYFKYYFEPRKFKGKYDKQIKALRKRITNAKSVIGQSGFFESKSLHDELGELIALNQPTLRPVYDTYRAAEIRAWSDKYSADVVRPILNWTAQEVISYCIAQGFPLNPLYYRGARRVGCYPCINSSLQEVAMIAKNDPWRIAEIAEIAEMEADLPGYSFFGNKKIPKDFQTGSLVKNGKTIHYPTINDVVKYVLGNPDQAELLDRTSGPSGCISHYNICETR